MLLNSARSDQFEFQLPTDIVYDDIAEHYLKVYVQQPTQMIVSIQDLLYDSVIGVDLMSMNAPVVQRTEATHKSENGYTLGTTQFYRGAKDVNSTIDKRITIKFRMSAGFINYFAMLETFFRYHNDKATAPFFQPMHFVAKYNKQPMYGIDFSNVVFASISDLQLDATNKDYSEQTFSTTWVFNDINFRTPSQIRNQ